MKKIFSLLNDTQFLLTAIVASFMGDILYSFYAYNQVANFEFFRSILAKALTANGLSLEAIDQTFVNEQFFLVKKSVMLLIIILLAFQVVGYLFFFKKKHFARSYVNSMSWLGLIASILLDFTYIKNLSPLALPFLIQTFFYLYVIVGINAKKEIFGIKTAG